MCAFHSRAFLVARSIYAARAAMAGRPLPPMPSPPPGEVCDAWQRMFGAAPLAGEARAGESPGMPATGGRLAGLFAAARPGPSGPPQDLAGLAPDGDGALPS